MCVATCRALELEQVKDMKSDDLRISSGCNKPVSVYPPPTSLGRCDRRSDDFASRNRRLPPLLDIAETEAPCRVLQTPGSDESRAVRRQRTAADRHRSPHKRHRNCRLGVLDSLEPRPQRRKGPLQLHPASLDERLPPKAGLSPFSKHWEGAAFTASAIRHPRRERRCPRPRCRRFRFLRGRRRARGCAVPFSCLVR